MVYVYSKKDFTLRDFIKLSEVFNKDAKILNSCMTTNYTKMKLEKNDITDFELITGFYPEFDIIADFNFGPIDVNKALTVEYLLNLIQSKNIDLNRHIERDVDDGYVFQEYDNIVFNNYFIILC